MAKVFISYQSDDRPTVTLLAGALAQSGHSVWWDRGLGADEEWHKQIADQLSSSEVVLAVWTRRSLDSRWVYSEADEADKDRKLVQATLDGTLPPKPFDRLQCIDLTAWAGDANDSRLAAIRDAIERTRQKLAGATVAHRALPDTSDAERAWMLICESLEGDDYRAFLRHHGNSPHAKFAQKNLDQLEVYWALDRTRPEQISDFLYSGPFKALGAAAKGAQADAETYGPEMRFYSYLPRQFEGLELRIDYSHGRTMAYAEPKTHKGAFSLLIHPFRDEWRSFVESELRENLKLRRNVDTYTDEGAIDGCPVLVTGGTEIADISRVTAFECRALIGGRYLLRAFGLGNSMLQQVKRLFRAIELRNVPAVYEGTLSREEIAALVSERESRPARQEGTRPSQDSRRDERRSGRKSGGAAGWIIALLLVAGMGAGLYYLALTSGLRAPGFSAVEDELAFTVLPFRSDAVLVARSDGSNYREKPFARDDVPVLAESAAQERLTITGVVHQPDGDWYEVMLRDGRTAYLKATLAEVEVPELPSATDPDLMPPGSNSEQSACPDPLSGPECADEDPNPAP